MYTRELIVHKPNHHHNRLRDEYFLVMGMIFGVLSMVCVTMGLLHYQNKINEVQIENLKQEYSELLDYHKETVASYEARLLSANESIEAAKEETATVQKEYDKLVADMTQEDEAQFNVISKYWYVLRDAEPDCGLTLGMMTYADALCKQKDINPDIIWTILDIESDFQPDAQNSKSSARGLGQLLASTAKSIYEGYMGNGKGSYSHNMAYNGYTNLEIVINYIAYLKENYGDIRVMINGYSGDQSGKYYNNFAAIMRKNGHNLNDLSYAGQSS